MIDQRVVLVADRIGGYMGATAESTSLELVDDEYFTDLTTALQTIAPALIHYDHPRQLIDNAHEHRRDVIFSVWSGERSANRRSLIAGICEAYGLAYLGADARVASVCQDKYLSHYACSAFGLPTPARLLIADATEVRRVADIPYPAVIKPNFEGGSIGMTAKNLVEHPRDAAPIVKRLLTAFHQPVILEQFIRGREVSIVLAGNATDVLVQPIEITLLGDGPPLSDTIWTFETKKLYTREALYTPVNVLTEQERANVRRLYQYLQKAEYLRIDGRLTADGFIPFELSPDVYLGVDGAVATAFAHHGVTHDAMLEHLLSLAISNTNKYVSGGTQECATQ